VTAAPSQGLLLSVVVPAYNEEKLLPGTLEAITAAVEGAGYRDGSWELRVVDNASVDATGDIARAAGATVVHEPRRQIARARNAGALEARGDWLLFVDADTHPSASLLRATRASMGSGRYCGGGAVIDGSGCPPGPRLMIGAWNLLSRSMRLACGAYLFCRSDVFRELGGFSETLYAAEELDLSRRLRRWGRPRGLGFHIIRDEALNTSLRKLELYSARELSAMALRGLLHPRRVLRDPRYLDAWYGGRR
jgi:glycosyltransferase involved in cell wall biosynthesis